jgi:RNA polymerase sigma-70 factor, ECF subfamily
LPPGPERDARTEPELVEAAQRGDTSAFDELYHRNRAFVLAVARRAAGRDEEAHDALQETFLYLVRKLPELRLDGKLSSLLYPVARRFALAARARAARVRSDDEALELATRAETPAPLAEGHEELVSVVRGLPSDLRETLLLRYADGLALAEVARALDVPLGTVKSRLHQALKLLAADARTRRYFG